MTPWLLAGYLSIGIGLASLGWRRTRGALGERGMSAALTVLLWPLWAPFAIEGARGSSGTRAAAPSVRALADEVLAAAEDAHACAEAAGLDVVFSADMVATLREHVERTAARVAEIDRTLAGPRWARGVEASRASAPRDDGPEALHARNVRRMEALRSADVAALRELAALLRALGSQIAVARFEGHDVGADASTLAHEVWARVEGLGAVLGPEAPGTRDGRAAACEHSEGADMDEERA